MDENKGETNAKSSDTNETKCTNRIIGERKCLVLQTLSLFRLFLSFATQRDQESAITAEHTKIWFMNEV